MDDANNITGIWTQNINTVYPTPYKIHPVSTSSDFEEKEHINVKLETV